MRSKFVANKKAICTLGIILGIFSFSLYPSYLLTKRFFNRYFDSWGVRLVDLEKRGLLSREFGAAWQDILAQDAMQTEAQTVTVQDTLPQHAVSIVNGVPVKDYPSLSIVKRLNEVRIYSNTITITDRKSRTVASIRTDHTRAKVRDFPQVLIKALIAAEDSRYYDNSLGFEFDSFIRAILRACMESVTHFSLQAPKGTSTITQQVAKLFVSHLDEAGRRQVSRSIDRKARELRLSAALRRLYPADDILEVYLNHCITSDYGLIGVRDIAKGLFNKELKQLTDEECIYIARMVKWGRNIHAKIARQCHVDMPRMGAALGWSPDYQQRVLDQIDRFTFAKPKQIATTSGFLVDLANEFWLLHLKKSSGNNSENHEKTMDLINPNSLIRKKGNLTIQLTIDLPLQLFLEELVNKRGFGPDTMIYTDVRIGSRGENIQRKSKPEDSLRLVQVADTIMSFSEAGSEFYTMLKPGDSLITNIRYDKIKGDTWRRSCFFYTRKWIKVNGQYFAYCIIDSRTGKMLAYYSRDKIGSRLACLVKNRIPNGSSTAKPVIHALNFDLGNFPPYATFNDSLPVLEDVPWKRTLTREGNNPKEVVFEHSSIPQKGYTVHNHGNIFEGCQHIFDHLATSNNIFGVEAIYRLNRQVFDNSGEVLPEAYPVAQLLYRINALDRLSRELHLKTITGVRLYKELCRIAGVPVDTITTYGKRVPISDSLYSVALGTLELSLYEQVHLFNMLHNNTLIENPAQHPALVIDRIIMNEANVPVSETDTIRQYHPFADMNNIRPVLLGLHKRLVSNPQDNLVPYDMAYSPDSGALEFLKSSSSNYSGQLFALTEPPSNYAKSGTTDDILRPFNVDVASDKRTNYGLWNATIRVDLARLAADTVSPDVHDITIACIGECNTQYTGARDGKTLHKYISAALLKKAGITAQDGFFRYYEEYLRRVTPDSVACAAPATREPGLLPLQKEFIGD